MDSSAHTATFPNCPDCGMPVGEHHKPSCDVERCPTCGQQKVACGCESCHTIWTGEWPETLQDAKTRLDEMLGLKSGWRDRHGQFILRSPNGFPLALVTADRGSDGRFRFLFEQPVGEQQSWLEIEEWLEAPCPCCGARNRHILQVLNAMIEFFDENGYDADLGYSILPVMASIPEEQQDLLANHSVLATAEGKVDRDSIVEMLNRYEGRF